MSWKRFAKTFLITLGASSLLLAVLGFILIRTGVVNAGALLRDYRMGRSTVRRESFSVSAEGCKQAAELDGSLLLLARNRVSLYGPDGETLYSAGGAFSESLLHQSGGWAVVYTPGETQLQVFSSRGPAYTASTKGAVLSASINDEGWLAVCSREERYQGAVTVFSDTGVSSYKLYSAHGFPVAAQVSPGDTRLAVLRLGEDGSSADVYDMRREDSLSTFRMGDAVLAELRWLGRDRLLLMGVDALVILDGQLHQIGNVELEDRVLQCCLSSDRLVMLLCSESRIDRSSTVLTLDLDCNVLAELQLQAPPDGVALRGRWLALLDGGRLSVYDMRLRLCGSYDQIPADGTVLLAEDGTALLLSGDLISVFD